MIGTLSLIGRDKELDVLNGHLDDAVAGNGSTILISGEPGIGKTRLVEEFQAHVKKSGLRILSGAAALDTIHPFLIFSKAFEEVMDRPLFHEQESISFAEIFAVNRGGLLVAQASSTEDEGMDADIFAGMLSAVQDFVRDSFNSSGERRTGLGRLEYGDMTILIENGDNIFLTAVLKSGEHPNMKTMLKQTVKEIETGHGHLLEDWDGQEHTVQPIQDIISGLAGNRFLVRKNLEGVKLENERIRIADQVLELLADMAKENTLLLLLGDLHWADESSLFVLNYVARNIAGHSILMVGTHRPGESQILGKTIEKMQEEGIIRTMELCDLGESGVTDLVNEMYPDNAFPSEFIGNLATRCNGNPFFVLESLKQMQEEGILAKDNGGYVLARDDYVVPDSVEEVVRRRLEGLEPDAMTLVEYSSCIGQEFTKGAAFSFHSLVDPDSALEKLQSTGILRAHEGTLMFDHAIFQDVVYNSIGGRWRVIYHKCLGEFYEGAYDADEVLYELAKHYSRSNEHDRSLDYCLRAGEKAESAFAVEQAVEFYELAKETLPHLKNRAIRTDMEREVLERLGDTCSLGWQPDKAVDEFNSILDMTLTAETEGRIRRKMSGTLEKKGDYDEAMEHLERARGLLEGKDIAEYGRVLSNIGLINQNRGEFDEAIKIQQVALGILGNFEDTKKDIATILNRIGVNYYYKWDYKQAQGYFSESLEIYEELDYLPGICNCLNSLGVSYAELGDYDKALEFNGRSLELRRRINDVRGATVSLNNIGVILMDLGEFEEAQGYYEEFLRTSEKVGDIPSVATAETNLGEILNAKGEYDLAAGHLKKAIEITDRLGDKHGLAFAATSLGKITLLSGNPADAEKYALKALDMSIEMGAKEIEGKSRRLLGMIYRAEEKYESAKEHLEMSISVMEGSGVKRGIGESYLEYGRLLRLMGDEEEARRQFDKALKVFENLNVKHEVKAVRRELEGAPTVKRS